MDNRQGKTLKLNEDDNVVIALVDIDLEPRGSKPIAYGERTISAGHKIATQAIAKGTVIRKYGHIIGVATRDIEPGEHVHTHNMGMGDSAREYEFVKDSERIASGPNREQAEFEGILHEDGSVATRNYIGVLPSVACSASVCRNIANAFGPEVLRDYPNVDGVVGLSHTLGCGVAPESPGFEYLQRSLLGYANHPNFYGILFIGLGCEVNQLGLLFNRGRLTEGETLHALSIQECGGTEAIVLKGIEIIKDMLPKANQTKRRPLPASHLTLGLECGGSDAFSGITANPALGIAADFVVRNGGSVILSETTEIYGAEQLLVKRAAKREVGEKLIDLIRWWEDYTKSNGVTINNNPSPGNKAGGLTTILEKSLGAVAKGGSTPLMDVYGYAQKVATRGLVFMDTPGYDIVSVTGMIAGGANIICFTTGCGTVLGAKPVPVIKLASNTEMYRRLYNDMDVDCGPIARGDQSIEEVGETIFQKILDTASGRKTKSEDHGYGDNEFVPWHIGAVL